MPKTLVYVTTKDKEEALTIAKIVVKERLAACANIIDGMRSVYQWQGEINEDQEAVLILKTKVSLFEKLEAKIQELHSYECPCIVSLPISKGHTPYLQWVAAETID